MLSSNIDKNPLPHNSNVRSNINNYLHHYDGNRQEKDSNIHFQILISIYNSFYL